MITAGIIREIGINKGNFIGNAYKVELNIFQIPGDDNKSNYTYVANCSTIPGLYDSYAIGDVVYVGFLNNNKSLPIILGKIYQGLDNKSNGKLNLKGLSVTGHTELSKNTFIGNISFSDIQSTVQQNALLQEKITDLENKITNIAPSEVDLSNYVEKDDNEILTTEDITINTDVGGLPSGTTINTGTSITDLIKLLGVKTYYPTFISPTLSLTINVANGVEAGYTSNATLTATFNKGEIKGALVAGVWNANTKQNDRAGDLDTYVINGVDTGGANTKTLTNNVIEEGANVYNAKVLFTTGPQPLDSDGNNYETPLAAGNISTSKTIYGYRKLFYGLSSQATNSAEVRTLSSSILNPTNGTIFTINITQGTNKVVFAYPATLRDVTEVKYVEGLNADVKSAFIKTTVSVEGVNGYSAINYKVYTYTPVNPFDSSVTYEVKI